MPKKLIDFSSKSSLSTLTPSLQTEQHHHSGVIRRIKPKQEYIYDTATNQNTNKKRFSCDELEVLKERFVDFIKLDQQQQLLLHQPSATPPQNK